MVLVRTWSIVCLSGKGKVCEELRKTDVYCLQEMGWRGHGAAGGEDMVQLVK